MQRMPMLDRKLAAFALLALVIALTAVAAVAHNASARSAVKPVNSASPAISGTAQEGQTLTASNGTWAGTAPITFSYQWSRCDQNGKSCAAINGATSSTFQLQRIDVDNTIIVTVTATNGDGNDSAPSAATAVVKSAASSLKPANVNPPTISGTAQEGQTLTANEGNWNTSPLNFTYQWSRCDQNGKSCAAISGSVGKSYQLQSVDVGNTLIVTVKATNNLGSDSAASDPTAVVKSGTSAPATTGCPSGTGVMQIADVSPPARLQIDHQTITPGVGDTLDELDPAERARDRVWRPAGAGRSALRDGGAVQPVLDPAGGDNRGRRHHHRHPEPADGLPGVEQAAAARHVPPGPEERGSDHGRHLDPAARLLPRQPEVVHSR